VHLAHGRLFHDRRRRYGQLFEYGMNAGDGAAAMSDDDPDSELVPQLVRKLVLPLALHWIERWERGTGGVG
jgi:GC-rich sequence DNA-binding factor